MTISPAIASFLRLLLLYYAATKSSILSLSCKAIKLFMEKWQIFTVHVIRMHEFVQTIFLSWLENYWWLRLQSLTLLFTLLFTLLYCMPTALITFFYLILLILSLISTCSLKTYTFTDVETNFCIICNCFFPMLRWKKSPFRNIQVSSSISSLYLTAFQLFLVMP